jgi:hypothetical protein
MPSKKYGKAVSEAENVLKAVKKWSFMLHIVIWYEMLFHIIKVSKVLQKEYGFGHWRTRNFWNKMLLEKYREEGLNDAEICAQEVASALKVDCAHKVHGVRCKKQMFEYEHSDEAFEQSKDPDYQFRKDFFSPLDDQALASVEERFEQISSFSLFLRLFVWYPQNESN